MSIIFEDPLDPSAEELRQWAYLPDADYPDEMPQDWELVITNFRRAPEFIKYASDPVCPNRKFFLGCLYLLAGDCVRTEAGRADVPQLIAFLNSVPDSPAEDIALWISRTRDLLSHPETFDYNKWCWFGYAYE